MGLKKSLTWNCYVKIFFMRKSVFLTGEGSGLKCVRQVDLCGGDGRVDLFLWREFKDVEILRPVSHYYLVEIMNKKGKWDHTHNSQIREYEKYLKKDNRFMDGEITLIAIAKSFPEKFENSLKEDGVRTMKYRWSDEGEFILEDI